jgi:hypothetical protein
VRRKARALKLRNVVGDEHNGAPRSLSAAILPGFTHHPAALHSSASLTSLEPK